MTTKTTKKVAMTTTNTTAKAVAKTVTVNFNQNLNGVEFRFNFKLSDVQRAWLASLKESYGIYWNPKMGYYNGKITPENYGFIAWLFETYFPKEAKEPLKVEMMWLKGSMKKLDKKALTK